MGGGRFQTKTYGTNSDYPLSYATNIPTRTPPPPPPTTHTFTTDTDIPQYGWHAGHVTTATAASPPLTTSPSVLGDPPLCVSLPMRFLFFLETQIHFVPVVVAPLLSPGCFFLLLSSVRRSSACCPRSEPEAHAAPQMGRTEGTCFLKRWGMCS